MNDFGSPPVKDSGVEWIGEIPEEWGVDRISHLFRLIASGTTPDSIDILGEEGEVNWVTTGELREGFISDTRQKVSQETLRSSSALRVYPTGTLLVAMYGATIGRLGILAAPACTNQACCAMSGPVDTSIRFIFYALQGAQEHIMVLASGGGQPNINQDKVRSLRLPVPPLDEQKQIADFLDRETKQIDNLIAEQQGLVENLTERLKAVISRAVFRGIGGSHFSNRVHTPVDSITHTGFHLAVEPALSNIPNDWRIVRFKEAMERLDERNADANFTMMSLKSSGDVVPRSSLNSNQNPSVESIPRYLVARLGNLVVNPMWLTGGSIGVSTVVGAVSPDYRVFQSRGFHEPRYLHHLLRSSAYIRQYKLYTRADTTFDRRVQQGDLDNLPLAVPPLAEQREIVAYLDDKTSKIDALIAEAKALVDLLKERRSALISAAVTGKIDVRSEVVSHG